VKTSVILSAIISRTGLRRFAFIYLGSFIYRTQVRSDRRYPFSPSLLSRLAFAEIRGRVGHFRLPGRALAENAALRGRVARGNRKRDCQGADSPRRPMSKVVITFHAMVVADVNSISAIATGSRTSRHNNRD